jgi:outer membrane protein TolC
MRVALGISLVLIFLILLIQFRTLSDALIVMAAFPLALPGAALGLFITHNPFGFTAFIGVISLGGLVVRNSIILVDYIHERMKHGVDLEEATLEAGERRLRPIFLTTMAAAVGVTPMIISRSSMWSPLASVIAFGLLGSMFFTLVVIPVLFVVVNTKKVSKPAVAVAASIALMFALATPSHAQQPGIPNDRLASSGGDQRTITLDEALQLAMKQNSAVRIAEQKAREAEAKVVQARANFFPTVKNETNAMHTGETQFLTIKQGVLGTYTGTGPLPGTDVKIQLGEQNFAVTQTTVAQPLTQMFKIQAGFTAAQAEARMAREELDRSRNEVSLNVKKLYYGLLSTEQRKRAAELRLQAGEARLKEASDAARSGVLLQVSVLEGDATIAEAKHTLGSLEDQVADQTNSFNDLVGLPIETATDLIEPAEPSEEELAADPAPADLEAEALAHNPELLSANQAVKQAHAGLKAAWAEYIPEVSFVLQHTYQNGAPLLPESTYAFGFNSEWTISEFGKRIGLVRERRAQVAETEESLHATRNKVRIDVESEIRKINRSDTGLQAARRSVTARTEIVRITSDQVVAKTTYESALKDAQARLADSKAQLFDAEMERAIAQAELVRTEGRQ